MCHKVGIVEPITAKYSCSSCAKWQTYQNPGYKPVQTGSPALIARVHIALREIADRSNDETSKLAKTFDEEIVARHNPKLYGTKNAGSVVIARGQQLLDKQRGVGVLLEGNG